MEKLFPRIGVGVAVLREGKLLFGKRRGKTSPGTWCFPGGHVEFGETAEQCAVRECREEASIELQNLRQVCFTSDLYPDNSAHYVTLFFAADWASGEPFDKKEESIGEWQWRALGDFPSPLPLFMHNFLEQKPDLKKWLQAGD